MRRSATKSPANAGGQPSHPYRLAQLASVLHHELGSLLPRELELPPGVLITVAHVEVLPDLSVARVAVTVLPFERGPEALKILQRQTREFQHTVNRHLELYRVPKLEFHLVDTAERADHIERLLDKVKPQE